MCEIEQETGNLEKNFTFALQLVKEITPSALKEIDTAITDSLKLWSGKRKVKILTKAYNFLEEKEISPSSVQAKMLFPILEYGSLEEDDKMIDKWSSLLANSADPSKNTLILPSFPEILKQLSPVEAQVLDEIYNLYMSDKRFTEKKQFVLFDGIIKKFDLTVEQYHLIVENLGRLELINALSKVSDEDEGYSLQFTNFGLYFVKACRNEK